MSRLSCTEHKRRSMILPSGKVIHRSGETCSSKQLKINGNVYTIIQAITQLEHNTPGERLIKDIFEDPEKE